MSLSQKVHYLLLYVATHIFISSICEEHFQSTNISPRGNSEM